MPDDNPPARDEGRGDETFATAYYEAGLRAVTPSAGSPPPWSLWHGKRYKPDGPVLYWCGNWYQRTSEQLLSECLTTVGDLLKNHPELITKMAVGLGLQPPPTTPCG